MYRKYMASSSPVPMSPVKALTCNYCACPPKVDAGCPPNPSACAPCPVAATPAALGPAPGPAPESGPSMPGWQVALIVVAVIIVLAILASWYASGDPYAFFLIFRIFST